MQAYFQKHLSCFQDAIAGLDELLALLVSCYPQAAEKLQADRAEFNNFLIRARELFQNPLLLPFHMVSFFFLIRAFAKRSDQCAQEVLRITEEQEMDFTDLDDDEILALFSLTAEPPQMDPAFLSGPHESPYPSSLAADPTDNPWSGLAGEGAPYSLFEPPCLGPEFFSSSTRFVSSLGVRTTTLSSLASRRLGAGGFSPSVPMAHTSCPCPKKSSSLPLIPAAQPSRSPP